jgi:hypothetical protein
MYKLKNLTLKALKYLVNKYNYEIVRKSKLVDFYLYEYDSYEDYKKTQIDFNINKIDRVWADETTLKRAINIILNANTTNEKSFGLCHGTRNGFEQKFLNMHNNIHAIGTDISPTATMFENTVMWDFHDVNESWINKFDFIYSNSLDQAWNPKQALTTWLNQVKKGGIVIIEHTEGHGPSGASKMDPFGVRPIALPYFLSLWFGNQISISHSVKMKDNKNLDAYLFVCRKLDDEVFLN